MVETLEIEHKVNSLDINGAAPKTSEASNGSGQSPAAGGIIAPGFGRKFGDEYFPFDEKVVNVNHGSYGTAPKAVVDAKFGYLRRAYGSPEKHFKLSIESKVKEIRGKVADIVDADVDNLVLVTNDTTGINTVLRNFPFKKGDKVVYANTSFINCINTLRFLSDTIGIELIKVDILYPMSNDEVVAAYTAAMDNNTDVRMALFDTVSSVPAALLPWERLCDECRKRNVLSIVDGAHGIGLIPISLRTARPDFFTSNLHKWFFTPVSLALLYVDSKHHNTINPLNIPANYKGLANEVPRSFSGQFHETGTIDYSNIQSVEDAIKFRNEVCGGEEKIRAYCFDLARQAGTYMAEQFNTEILSGKEDSISTSMITLQVPFQSDASNGYKVFTEFTSYICSKWNTFVPIFHYNNAWWVRLSAHIYLDMDDFKYATTAILDSLDHLKATI